jgi:hypothetical protein
MGFLSLGVLAHCKFIPANCQDLGLFPVRMQQESGMPDPWLKKGGQGFSFL